MQPIILRSQNTLQYYSIIVLLLLLLLVFPHPLLCHLRERGALNQTNRKSSLCLSCLEEQLVKLELVTLNNAQGRNKGRRRDLRRIRTEDKREGGEARDDGGR